MIARMKGLQLRPTTPADAISLLDLYREHPEEVVLAQKDGLDVHFQRLADKPDIEEILGDAPLSEAWYSGILGGVPSSP